MKKWHKRSLFVLLLGAVGTVALGLRPALTPDTLEVIEPFASTIQLPQHLRDSNFSFTHIVNPSAPQRGTWFSDGDLTTHRLLRPSEWTVQVQCKDGTLSVEATPPEQHADGAHVRAVCFAGIGEAMGGIRRPNGRIHTEYLLHVSCMVEYTPCFWQAPRRAQWVQFITIDVDDEAADMGTGLLTDTDNIFFSKFTQSTDGTMAVLPARYCNTPVENAMLRLLHTLAACTEDTHDQLTPRLLAGSKLLNRFATEADWPECWGNAAGMARDMSYRVGPTLVYLNEKGCFGNEQLIKFINSREFSRIFGEDFRNSKNADINLELQGIDFERVNKL